jgi:hypothetical protein
MFQIRKFYRNGRPAWDIKASAVVIAVLALMTIALATGENTSSWIAALFTGVK